MRRAERAAEESQRQTSPTALPLKPGLVLKGLEKMKGPKVAWEVSASRSGRVYTLLSAGKPMLMW